MKAMGKRYDTDPRIAWVEVGSYGIWGEWHVWQNEKLSATLENRKKIVQHYTDHFKQKKLIIPYGDKEASQKVLASGHGGLRNDCLGLIDSHEWFEKRLDEIISVVGEKKRRDFVMGGEFCTNSSALNLQKDLEKLSAFLLEHRFSFIGPAIGFTENTSKEALVKISKLQRQMGYAFTFKEFQIPKYLYGWKKNKIKFLLENTGVATFPYAWKIFLALYHKQTKKIYPLKVLTSVDPRKWETGTHSEVLNFSVTDDIPKGRYQLWLGLGDPLTQEVAVPFFIEGRNELGYYDLGSTKL
ncbi:MAG: DUF4832 domain-containing protein, partial [Bacteriovoracaceae bacterium]|nr:DUF4832 domain-containing protein [Bacteriovoracaceae bacterium]